MGVATQFAEMFQESGVTISPTEAMTIVRKVRSNPAPLKDSFEKIVRSLIDFNREISGDQS